MKTVLDGGALTGLPVVTCLRIGAFVLLTLPLVACVQPTDPDLTLTVEAVDLVQITAFDCTGESAPEIYFDIRINGVSVARQADGNGTLYGDGSVISVNRSTTLPQGQSFQLAGVVTDDDGDNPTLNADDPVASWNFSPSTAVGPGTRAVGSPGCNVNLRYSIAEAP